PHRTPALAREPDEVVGAERARPVERRQLAEAVSDGALRLDAESPQQPEAGERRRDDRGLRERRVDGIVRGAETRPLHDLAGPAEPARERPAVRRGRRALAGEEVADARRRAGSERDAPVEEEPPAGGERVREHRERRLELPGPRGDDRGAELGLTVRQAGVELRGEVPELREAEPA